MTRWEAHVTIGAVWLEPACEVGRIAVQFIRTEAAPESFHGIDDLIR